ncbi:GNAT family N-acetyltransferase [Ferrimonas lipolytica]|uniref:N-acetyltransferase n=1 Tax=Ferrimonas lipolytica TaxID=2724191 RepID=A0A6H1UF89_9GAMM|nr:GNAT family N-acetyltransferase [Ferrimonas lipolytica]QIZ77765.1 N-acetyltransferase [Ferrimonas lipolytica]
MKQIIIRDYVANDAAALLAVYNDAIINSSATFEEQPLPLTLFSQRLETIQQSHPLLVATIDNEVVGYAYGGHYKPRSAYRFCAEVTIYVNPQHHGHGIAKRLYPQLFKRLKSQGIQQLLAIITEPNDASAQLHRSFGFEKVGLMHRVGFKFERWYDVAIWQKALPS